MRAYEQALNEHAKDKALLAGNRLAKDIARVSKDAFNGAILLLLLLSLLLLLLNLSPTRVLV